MFHLKYFTSYHIINHFIALQNFQYILKKHFYFEFILIFNYSNYLITIINFIN